VAAHVDVTSRRRAEEEARRSRQELAHFLRVSTVGELTTSLAHELNQPLTAILANAEAARLLLDNVPQRAELHQILTDIADEDRRASEVIRRLRSLLRKEAPERMRLDLNSLAEDVQRLTASDATSRGVGVRIVAAEEPAWVNGDRIQLQQVVLNLLSNAIEAVSSAPVGERRVLVTTCVAERAQVRLSVHDNGPGIPEEKVARVFDPFYTTKPEGMGMGLAIARTIVEAHGGQVTVRPDEGHGVTFTVTLPYAN
jgi:signal transduction histidine kinase